MVSYKNVTKTLFFPKNFPDQFGVVTHMALNRPCLMITPLRRPYVDLPSFTLNLIET